MRSRGFPVVVLLLSLPLLSACGGTESLVLGTAETTAEMEGSGYAKQLLLTDGTYATRALIDGTAIDLSAPLVLVMNANIEKAAFGAGFTGTIDLVFLYEVGTTPIDYTTSNISAPIEGDRIEISPFTFFEVPLPVGDRIVVTELEIELFGDRIGSVEFFDHPFEGVTNRHLLTSFAGRIEVGIPRFGFSLPGTFTACRTEARGGSTLPECRE